MKTTLSEFPSLVAWVAGSLFALTRVRAFNDVLPLAGLKPRATRAGQCDVLQ